MVFLGNAEGNDLAVKVLLGPWYDAGGANVLFEHSHDVHDALKKPGVFAVFFLQQGSFDPINWAVDSSLAGFIPKFGHPGTDFFIGVVHDGGGPGGKG